jgi:hypothetical protein
MRPYQGEGVLCARIGDTLYVYHGAHVKEASSMREEPTKQPRLSRLRGLYKNHAEAVGRQTAAWEHGYLVKIVRRERGWALYASEFRVLPIESLSDLRMRGVISEISPNELVALLVASKVPIDRLPAPPDAGVYAMFLDGADIPGLSARSDSPIYVGSSANLAQREFETHFVSRSTGFSTLRRTLGALLKEELGLVSRPRGRGKTKQDFLCYRFEAEGEDRLTDWMKAHIHIAVHPMADEVSAELGLIFLAHPPLNLTGCANPDATEIKRRRKICEDEARRRRWHDTYA